MHRESITNGMDFNRSHCSANTNMLPEMASMEVVARFQSEADALAYSIDRARQRSVGLTRMKFADVIGWSRANLTKVLQEQASIPKDSHVEITKHTNCLALAQYRNHGNGLVTKTLAQEKQDRETLRMLHEENAELKRELKSLKGTRQIYARA